MDQIVYCVSCHYCPAYSEDSIEDPFIVTVYSTENAAQNYVRSKHLEQLEEELRRVKSTDYYQPFFQYRWNILRYQVEN
jgi:hypothetical protein